ncbi:NAD P-binding protein [Gloeophyllum trabeum ATCC 11539]|uniref:NAD P-binding protein n=1 Tax=Gloeophyllum trabeum (strain ATCC 11539 / FP-39264 / Madison 617) TaxID=670483 RepID=S7QHB8_GLOTA|nr:NAD P-binding protein [Gloeophyllum trabeum ATCC 11539]EPQ59201.1 NAD P-binding protein [Gloeophyllum trabeum ATCC 11539]
MGQLSRLDVALRQLAGAPELGVKADLAGKTVIVVGANTGIGIEAVKHFSSMNAAKVIMACRSEEKGKKAVAEVEKATGKNNAELWLLDLGRFASVVEFADRFEKEGGRLDILVMNAGIATGTYEDFEGWESTLHVNHLSTALCSLLLIPRLLKTASDFSIQTRLVVVSSEVHHFTTLSEEVRNSPSILKKLNEKEYFQKNFMDRYPVSKLLNVLFVRALNAHLPTTSPLIVDAVNPGFCKSELTRNIPDFKPPTFEYEGKTITLTAWTSEEGSRQLLWAALGPPNPADTDKIRGAFVSGNHIEEPSDFVLSKEGKDAQDRLWNETLEILNEVTPKVNAVVKEYLSV